MSRRTSQRAAILSVLRNAERPLSVHDIVERGRAEAPRLSRATVYRNLRVFLEKGEVRAVAHPDLGTLYEAADRGHHHHFHCRVCDRLYELPGCALDVRGSTPPGFRTERHEVFLYGACPECREA